MAVRYSHPHAHFCAIYAYMLQRQAFSNDEIAEIMMKRRPYVPTLIRRGKVLSQAPKVKR